MDLKAFKASTKKDKPPQGIPPALEAMWHKAKGDWDTAHRLAQSQKNPMGNWSMLTCIALKPTKAMSHIGIA